MKCATCSKNVSLKAATAEHIVRVDGHDFRGALAATRCPSCGETYVDGEEIGRFELRVAATLARAGNVSGPSFRFMRKALGYQAKEMIDVIGTPPETISRWEKGARDVDRFAWVTLATMVVEKVEDLSPVTRDVLRATLTPTTLPKVMKVA